MRRAVLALTLLLAFIPCRAGAAALPYLTCGYYEPKTFMESVGQAAPYETAGSLRAGVVPHHLLAARLIASFFATASLEPGGFDTVVFVAPSHYPTDERAVTTLSGWRTPFGTAEIDAPLTRRLMESGLRAAPDEANMQLDHAVSGLIPYVKYYLPQAKVAAVLLQNRLEWERAEALARELAAIGRDKNILLVCSIDFSHYLMPDEAARRDEETRRAVEDFDFTAIRKFHDDHMDSPQSMTVFLRYLAGQDLSLRILDHGSAEQFLKLPLTDPAYRDGVTTYFILGGARDNAPPKASTEGELLS